jgi:hypothetical protein
LASRSCKNRGEKHLQAFVKVVDGSEIYNFGIHCSEHFSSSFGRKTRSKSPKSAHSRCTRRRAATSRRPERRARRASVHPPPWRPVLPAHLPRSPLPKAGSTPRCLEVFPCHVSRCPSPFGHATMDRRSVPCPGTRAPTKAAAVPRREAVGLLGTKQVTICL